MRQQKGKPMIHNRASARLLPYVLPVLALLLGLSLVRARASHSDRRGELRSGGVSRTYLLHVPPSYDGSRAVPLVLAFHGVGGQGWGMSRLSGFDALSDRRGFLVVYPDGLSRQWNDGREGRTGHDVAFVADL